MNAQQPAVQGMSGSDKREGCWRSLSARVPCAGLLAALFVATAAGAVRADPRFHGGRVYVAWDACTQQQYRPAKIVLACGDGGLYATNIRYRFYGGKTAYATASLHTHSCVPNCAQSSFHAFPGTIELRDVVRCEGTLYYSRARDHFIHVGPYGDPGSGTADIEPLGEGFKRICGPILG